MNGRRIDLILIDELVPGARREVIVGRPDGRTHAVQFPAAMDLGEVVQPGELVVFDAGEVPA